MIKRKNLLFVFVTILVCCILGQVSVFFFGNGSVSADASALFKVGDGASIRVVGNNADEYGIKFRATVPDNQKSYNMLIVPRDYFEGYKNLPEQTKAQYDNVVDAFITAYGENRLSIVKNCPFADDNTIEGSIITIKPTNIERDFTAIAYYETKDNGETVYHVADLADDGFRSIASVASRAINAGVYSLTEDAEVIGVLKNFIGEENLIKVALPDYEDYQSNYFAYKSVSNGKFNIDLEQYSTEDLLTLEKLSEFKQAGFNVLYSGFEYNGEDANWETSRTKRAMDLAAQLGLKVVVTDYRVLNLVTRDTSDAVFASDEAMDQEVAGFIQKYATHDAFYGINMFDEPTYAYAERYGKVYKSLKRVVNENYGIDPYLHSNLLPIYANEAAFTATPSATSQYESFELYLRSFIESTALGDGTYAMDRLSIDVYPYRAKTGMIGTYYLGLQVFAETCQEYGVETTMVVQSYSGYDPTTDSEGIKAVTVNDMHQQLNVAAAMGITDFVFYEYMPNSSMTFANGGYTDIGSFLTISGDKTNIYYYGQQAMKELNAAMKILGNFDYLSSKFVRYGSFNISSKYAVTGFNNSRAFTGSINTVIVDNATALVSEFYDSQNGLNAYAIVNPIDEFTMTSSNNYDVTANLTFDSGYDYVAEIYAGGINYVKLDGGAYTKTLSPGYAVYIIPLNSSVNTGLSSTYGVASVKLADSDVYYQIDESIDLFDLINEEPGVEYSFSVNGKAVKGRTYFVSSTGTYTVTVTATKGGNTATATTTFTANERKPFYHDRFVIVPNTTGFAWYDMGCKYYTVSVDGGAEINVGTALAFDYAVNNVSAGNHTISLKGYMTDGSYRETVSTVVYSPDGVVLSNAKDIKEGSYLDSTSGEITYTSKVNSISSASFITVASDFTDEFLRVNFVALGSNFVESGLGIGIKNSSCNGDMLNGWALIGNNSHGMMINYGANYFMNRFNAHGNYTDIIGSRLTFKCEASFVVGEEYSIIFGITGTGADKVMHVYILDKNETIVRYLTITWEQMTAYAQENSKTVPDIPDSGSYVIYNSADVERTISYEVIPADSISVITTAVSGVTANGSVVSWNAMAGAAGYKLRVDGGKWVDVGNVNSYNVAALAPVGAANCKVEVKAYFDGGYTSKKSETTTAVFIVYPETGDNNDGTMDDVYN